MPKRGPRCKIGYHKMFNYILKVLRTGIQWDELSFDITGAVKPNADNQITIVGTRTFINGLGNDVEEN